MGGETKSCSGVPNICGIREKLRRVAEQECNSAMKCKRRACVGEKTSRWVELEKDRGKRYENESRNILRVREKIVGKGSCFTHVAGKLREPIFDLLGNKPARSRS